MSNFYRNIRPVVSDQGVEIDEGSLWEFNKEQNLMTLVDEDEFHTSKPSDQFVRDKQF